MESNAPDTAKTFGPDVCDPKFAKVLSALGGIYREQGNYELAETSIRESLRIEHILWNNFRET